MLCQLPLVLVFSVVNSYYCMCPHFFLCITTGEDVLKCYLASMFEHYTVKVIVLSAVGNTDFNVVPT